MEFPILDPIGEGHNVRKLTSGYLDNEIDFLAAETFLGFVATK
jgi:hypothetical protein